MYTRVSLRDVHTLSHNDYAVHYRILDAFPLEAGGKASESKEALSYCGDVPTLCLQRKCSLRLLAWLLAEDRRCGKANHGVACRCCECIWVANEVQPPPTIWRRGALCRWSDRRW